MTTTVDDDHDAKEEEEQEIEVRNNIPLLVMIGILGVLLLFSLTMSFRPTHHTGVASSSPPAVTSGVSPKDHT